MRVNVKTAANALPSPLQTILHEAAYGAGSPKRRSPFRGASCASHKLLILFGYSQSAHMSLQLECATPRFP